MSDSVWSPRSKVQLSAPDFVISQIKQGLIEQKLKPGERLPSETELVELMGVSRGSVRQAMKALETLGVVSIRPGDGTYINDSVSGKSLNMLIFALLLARPSLKDIIDFRYALERDIIELIFVNESRIDDLLIELEKNIEKQQSLLDEGASIEALVENDQHFHFLLSQNCGNTLIQIIYNFVMEYYGQFMFKTTTRQNFLGENHTVRDHRQLVEAMKTHDFSKVKLALKYTVNTWQQYMREEDFSIPPE